MSTHFERRTQDAMLGRVLMGRYRIVRELARGGMGIVYLARSEGAEGFVKPVVVKLILREHAHDERFLGMFTREAKILASLRDPSIVDVLEFGEDGGDYVMVLEYVRGYHLGQWKRYLKTLGRVVPTDIMVQIGIDILTALHHAHVAKHPDGRPMHIIHRDVSPSNILLDSSGRPRLLDFGVARMRGGTQAYKTQVKSVVGKAPYLSPELLAGEDATAQSDLYACAVVIHETLYGKNVFRGNNEAMTLYRVLHHTVEPVSQVRNDAPPGLDDVLATALAKSPADRFKTADQFARALRALQAEPEHDVRDRLAILLERDFGEEMAEVLGIESLSTRDDAWSRPSQLPGTADSEGPSSAEVGVSPDDTAGIPTAEGRRRSRVPPPPPPSVSLPPPPPAHSPAGTPPPVPAMLTGDDPAARPAPGRLSTLLIAALTAGAVAYGIQQWVTRQGGSDPTASAAPIQVVQQALPEEPSPPGEPVVETAPKEQPSPDAGGQAQASDQATNPGSAPKRSHDKPRRKPRAGRTGPDAAALTRAFRRKQAAIRDCFSGHGSEPANLPRIEVEFALDARGTLKRARVMPRKVASTALGQCIERVAKSARFPAQGQPVVFTIPVTARAVR